MRDFTYVIGSTDDFDSVESLKEYFLSGDNGDRNFSFFPVRLSEECRIEGYKNVEEIAAMIGRGEAMSDGWCLDDTVSILLEG
jgi:hypothetical protein